MIHWIDLDAPGRLGTMARPRGGERLELEAARLASLGATVVVSLLLSSEATRLDLQGEEAALAAASIRFHSQGLPDFGVPPSEDAFEALARRLAADVTGGERVVVHCRAGIGRSSMLAACVLAVAGIPVEDAFSRIERARGLPVPDTAQQREWTAAFARDRLGVR